MKITALSLTAFLMATSAAADVVVNQKDGLIVLNNGQTEVIIDKAGDVVSFKDLRDGPVEMLQSGQQLNWDANAETLEPHKTAPHPKLYFRRSPETTRVELVKQSPELADVKITSGPTEHFPFVAERHYVMKDGLPGIYAYVVIRHTPDMAAARFIQTRYVFRTSPEVFNAWTISHDDIIRIPRSEIISEVMDATFRLADGTVKTKYLNSVYWGDVPAYGTLAVSNDKSRGIWMIEPSAEYHNGGPIKQGQTVHDDIMLRVLQSQHFGSKTVELKRGEDWSKVYGPFLIYTNQGATPQALWNDVDRQLAEEKKQWPYDFVTVPEYVKTRGGLSGEVRLDGAVPAHSKIILSDLNVPWPDSVKGYNYWADVSADGSFRIDGIVPGTYAVSVSGADEPVDFSGRTVTVEPKSQTLAIDWQRTTHGKTLWQLGTFDRKAAEFRNGDNARGYQMFTLYPEQFPNDVDYTLGSSRLNHDWNYAQWSWYAKKPEWHLRFKSAPQTGTATLSIGIASAQPVGTSKLTDVRVALNGQELGSINLPKTGTAGYRGGMQDQNHNVIVLTFDAALLKADNDLTFRHADGEVYSAELVKAAEAAAVDPNAPTGFASPGQVMYDAIRLEVK